MRGMVLLGLLATTGALPAQAATPAVVVLLGKGGQIYECAQTGTASAWRAQGP